MTKKFDVGEILEVKTAQMMYEGYRIASVITDGKYVQIEKEPIRQPNEIGSEKYI